MDILYRTNATVTGGRTGHGRSEDGLLDIQFETAKELGGNGNGTNPEQLFGVGYAACFLGAIRFVAGQRKIRIADDATVTASVGIGKRDDGRGFGLDVALAVDLPGIDPATAQELVDAAHVVCPYSEATRSNLNVRLSVVERA